MSADYLHEWLKRVEDKIDKVESSTSSISAISQRLNEHHVVLYGNGQPGVIKDVDRLKQLRKALAWLIGLIVVGSATSGAELIKAAVEVLK